MKLRSETRILVVDDDPLVGEMIEAILVDIGYQIADRVFDGQQAVDAARRLLPDAVLMDVEMPVMNGLDAMQHIHDSCPAPVVILTADDDDGVVGKASDAGAGAYLVKPPSPAQLDRAIVIAMARFEDLMRLRKLNTELKNALRHIKTLNGLLPICACCKKIRDDKGYWQQVEVYIRDHSGVEFSHGICPSCTEELYPDYAKKLKKRSDKSDSGAA